MIACQPPDDGDTLLIAAQAPREDVMFNTNMQQDESLPVVPHVANGVAWYWNTSYSFGFAPEGEEIVLNVCDVVDGDDRICIHFDRTFIYFGYRCGNIKNAYVNNYYRTILQTNDDP